MYRHQAATAANITAASATATSDPVPCLRRDVCLSVCLSVCLHLPPPLTQARGGQRAVRTEHGPRRHRLLVDPEGHLGEDDGHDAGDVRLDHEVAHLPLEVEVNRHHHVLTCRSTLGGS